MVFSASISIDLSTFYRVFIALKDIHCPSKQGWSGLIIEPSKSRILYCATLNDVNEWKSLRMYSHVNILSRILAAVLSSPD